MATRGVGLLKTCACLEQNHEQNTRKTLDREHRTFSADAGPDKQACAVWEWIEGRPAAWGADESCLYDEAEFGELLRRIHDLAFEGSFGILGDDLANRRFQWAPELGPTSDSWAGYFHFDNAARRLFDRSVLDRREADALAALPARLAHLLASAQPRLLHMGDIMHNGNMILDPASGRILKDVLRALDGTC